MWTTCITFDCFRVFCPGKCDFLVFSTFTCVFVVFFSSYMFVVVFSLRTNIFLVFFWSYTCVVLSLCTCVFFVLSAFVDLHLLYFYCIFSFFFARTGFLLYFVLIQIFHCFFSSYRCSFPRLLERPTWSMRRVAVYHFVCPVCPCTNA